MAWWYLLAAGIFEVRFAISMKLMDGHKNIPWSIAFYACVILSFGFLEQAVKTIPIGTAYAIWTGIGGLGVAAIGIFYFGDSAAPLRIFFLFLLVSAVIGWKLTSSH